MKKMKKVFCFLFVVVLTALVVFFFIMGFFFVGTLMAEAELVPITRLGIAPWLGKIQDEKDLLEKLG